MKYEQISKSSSEFRGSPYLEIVPVKTIVGIEVWIRTFNFIFQIFNVTQVYLLRLNRSLNLGC